MAKKVRMKQPAWLTVPKIAANIVKVLTRFWALSVALDINKGQGEIFGYGGIQGGTGKRRCLGSSSYFR